MAFLEVIMTLFPGRNEILRVDKSRADAGFVLCSALFAVLVASVFVLGWAKFEQVRSSFIEKKSAQFYSELESSSLSIKSEWENGGEKNNETL